MYSQFTFKLLWEKTNTWPLAVLVCSFNESWTVKPFNFPLTTSKPFKAFVFLLFFSTSLCIPHFVPAFVSVVEFELFDFSVFLAAHPADEQHPRTSSFISSPHTVHSHLRGSMPFLSLFLLTVLTLPTSLSLLLQPWDVSTNRESATNHSEIYSFTDLTVE